MDLDAEGGFTWQEAELSDSALPDLLDGFRLEPGQIADLSPRRVGGWLEASGEPPEGETG